MTSGAFFMLNPAWKRHLKFSNLQGNDMAISVEVRGDIEKAIRLLKKQVQREGLQRELRSRRYYEKPSVKKKRKRLEAGRRRKRFKLSY